MVWILIFSAVIIILIAIFNVAKNGDKKSKARIEQEEEDNERIEKYFKEKEDRRRKAYEELGRTREEFDDEFSSEISFEFDVAGIFYRTYEAKRTAKQLYCGEEVSLRHDKNNNYSNHAIKVIAERYHIGFVPDDIAEEMLTCLQKYKYKAIVLQSFTEFDSLKFDDVTEVTIKAYFFKTKK